MNMLMEVNVKLHCCRLREALSCKVMVKPTQRMQHSVLHVQDVIVNSQKDKQNFKRQIAALNSKIDSAIQLCEQQRDLITHQQKEIASYATTTNK